jgi:acylphosphatase
MMKRFHIFVSGHVQGVCYRDFTKNCAMLLGIKGFSRNLPDGRVELVVEGQEHDLKEFLAKLHVGPDAASVESIIKEDEIPKGGFKNFEIIH